MCVYTSRGCDESSGYVVEWMEAISKAWWMRKNILAIFKKLFDHVTWFIGDSYATPFIIREAGSASSWWGCCDSIDTNSHTYTRRAPWWTRESRSEDMGITKYKISMNKFPYQKCFLSAPLHNNQKKKKKSEKNLNIYAFLFYHDTFSIFSLSLSPFSS